VHEHAHHVHAHEHNQVRCHLQQNRGVHLHPLPFLLHGAESFLIS
jgi:hypothetical protein